MQVEWQQTEHKAKSMSLNETGKVNYACDLSSFACFKYYDLMWVIARLGEVVVTRVCCQGTPARHWKPCAVTSPGGHFLFPPWPCDSRRCSNMSCRSRSPSGAPIQGFPDSSVTLWELIWSSALLPRRVSSIGNHTVEERLAVPYRNPQHALWLII